LARRRTAGLDFAVTLRTQWRFDMISSHDARLRVQENLTGFPQGVADAYLAFAEKGDLARLDEVVVGVLQFYLAKPPAAPLGTLPGSTRLVADLGCDSLTMIDVMFLAENLLGIKLADDELARIETLDQLREHFRRRMLEVGKPAA
jgi:acyl carrier protein